MSEFLAAVSTWTLLAADEVQSPLGGLTQFLPFFIGMAMLAYFFLFLPERRERQRKEQLRKSMKKNDRVVTIGGMLGTVANISADGNEITLKIDEATGTKMRVLRSAIHEVLRDKDDDPKKDDAKGSDTKGEGAKANDAKKDQGQKVESRKD